MKRIFGLAIIVVTALAAVYGGLIYYDNNFKYGRMRETPVVKPHENPIPPMESGVVPIHGGEAVLKAGYGEAHLPPLNPLSAETLAQGEKVYLNYCVYCHGKYFDGMGTVGQSFHPLPQNLKGVYVQGQDDSSLFKVISYGITRMPPLATTVSVEDRWAVIYYLRSLVDLPEGSRKKG